MNCWFPFCFNFFLGFFFLPIGYWKKMYFIRYYLEKKLVLTRLGKTIKEKSKINNLGMIRK